MKNVMSNKLDEIEQSVSKVAAVGTFLYEMAPEDFVGDDGFYGDVLGHGAFFIKLEAEKIQKQLNEIHGMKSEDQPTFAN